MSSLKILVTLTTTYELEQQKLAERTRKGALFFKLFDSIKLMKIGFFDSGLGGLIALKAVAKALPQYDYEFYGDTANLPYGDKTEEEIYELTKAGIKHLFDRGL